MIFRRGVKQKHHICRRSNWRSYYHLDPLPSSSLYISNIAAPTDQYAGTPVRAAFHTRLHATASLTHMLPDILL